MGLGQIEHEHEPDPFLERKLVLENEHITLWYYPRLKIVRHHMVHTPTSEEFRELLDKGAETLERYRAKKWMSDDRGNTVLRPQDEQWADTVWLPRVLRIGFKYWAIVLPRAAIGKLNMQRLAEQHARRGIISHVEAEPEPAFEWLKAQSTER